jgi:hypothetical protein
MIELPARSFDFTNQDNAQGSRMRPNPTCSCRNSNCPCCLDSLGGGEASPSAALVWTVLDWIPSWWTDYGVPETCTGGGSWLCEGYIWQPGASCTLQSAFEVELECIQDSNGANWQWYWLGGPSGRVPIDGSFRCGACDGENPVAGRGETTFGPLHASESGGTSIDYYVQVRVEVTPNCI